MFSMRNFSDYSEILFIQRILKGLKQFIIIQPNINFRSPKEMGILIIDFSTSAKTNNRSERNEPDVSITQESTFFDLA